MILMGLDGYCCALECPTAAMRGIAAAILSIVRRLLVNIDFVSLKSLNWDREDFRKRIASAHRGEQGRSFAPGAKTHLCVGSNGAWLPAQCQREVIVPRISRARKDSQWPVSECLPPKISHLRRPRPVQKALLASAVRCPPR